MSATTLRAEAARALAAVHRGQALDQALAQAKLGDGDSRALLHELVTGTVRWQGLLQGLLALKLKDPARPLDPLLRALILLGIYQLRFMRLPPYAAVKETVDASALIGHGWARGLVNALLRGVQRLTPAEEETFPESVRDSHPAWLLTQLEAAWPEDYRAVVGANNQVPPLALRVNTERTGRDAYLERLRALRIDAIPLPTPEGLVLASRRPVLDLPGFADGQVSVQDGGAQWIPQLLPIAAGDRVLDACAAPGGKAAHLLEQRTRTGMGPLIALDRTPERVALLRETLSRLRLPAIVRSGDAAAPETWWDGDPFDAILLDAPCSGTGVIRRHPDIKWLRREDDLPRLAAEQLRLLHGLWPTLRAGGTLLYVTCSVLPMENTEVIGAFLEQQADARVVPLQLPVGRACAYGWQILPGEGNMDGFFYARLHKLP